MSVLFVYDSADKNSSIKVRLIDFDKYTISESEECDKIRLDGMIRLKEFLDSILVNQEARN